MDIFINKHLHLGHFSEMNDPMEAMFNASELTNYQIQQIKLKKPNIVIGCFSKTYSDVLMYAGKNAGANPYVLASMIITEQGSDGKGGSISGKVEGYKGFYNFLFKICFCYHHHIHIQ